MKAGISAAAASKRRVEAVVFLLGDQPFVTERLVNMVIAEFLRSQAPVVRPVLDGRAIHPVLVGRSLFAELLEQEGDVGARDVVRRHLADAVLVPISDRSAGEDVDTSEDYHRIMGQRPPGDTE